MLCAVLTLASLLSNGIRFPHRFRYRTDDEPKPVNNLLIGPTTTTKTKAPLSSSLSSSSQKPIHSKKSNQQQRPKSDSSTSTPQNTRKRRYYSTLSRDRLPASTKAGFWKAHQQSPNQPPPEPAKLSNAYLDRFIVIPEYKLLFCYIEKVGCSMFNHLFRMLRMVHPEISWKELLYQANGTWFRNTPQHFNLTKDDLAQLLIHPNWTKALFFRAPAPRFLSAYQSKCVVQEDYGFHCDKAFRKRRPTSPPLWSNKNTTLGGAAPPSSSSKSTGSTKSSTVVSIGDALAALSNHTTTTTTTTSQEQVFSDVHFAPQSWFCGGLQHTLQYYDFVHQLRPKTTAYHVRHLFQSLQVPPPISDYLIDRVVRTGGTQKGLDQTFVRRQPHYQQLKKQERLRSAAVAAAQRKQQPPPNNTRTQLNSTVKVAVAAATAPWQDVILKSDVTQTKAHNTGSNKGHALQDRLHNDNSRLQLIHRGYESDYTLFQIPYLTLEELTLAGV
jgi:hypothetical protein